MNDLGLINIFAQDICFLSEHHKKIWAAFNVSPEGKVCKELLMSQVNAEPARTFAPEFLLFKVTEILDTEFKAKFGKNLFEYHIFQDNINLKIQRFCVLNLEDLFKLAQLITKYVIERINIDNIDSILTKDYSGLGSIKKIEKLLSQFSIDGYNLTSVLVGVYELRLAESHLSSSDLDDSIKIAGLNMNQPFPLIGKQLIFNVANCLKEIFIQLEGIKKS